MRTALIKEKEKYLKLENELKKTINQLEKLKNDQRQ
jgi:hypothetical protein